MSTVFLSHSSKDAERARALHAWLAQHGHTVFLDVHPDDGLVAGADWEQSLYDHLARCSAVLLLLSPSWLASRWCFAEAVHARSHGKLVIPVRIAGEERAFDNLQEIDWRGGDERALEQLQDALERVFPWSGNRSPYPGLAAYTEDEAAVYFGRDPEIAQVVERLEALRRQRSPDAGLLLLLGASGSGKSSLLRAGVLPRLAIRRHSWIVVPPVRPHTRPLDELGVSLAAALGGPVAPLDAPHALADAVRLLRERNGGTPTVLLPIDQAEELFGPAPDDDAVRCLALVRSGIERAAGGLIVVMTMRSDFLDAFQSHPFLDESASGRRPVYDRSTLDPLPASRLPAVIEGPARVAGMAVEPALVAQLLDEMRGEAPGHRAVIADALPLLGFTLRRVWEYAQARHDASLGLGDHPARGGFARAVAEAAREALAGTAEHTPEMDALHAAFVPGLVRLTGDGRLVRRRARWSDLPAAAHASLRRFVDARLLVSNRDPDGQPSVELVHESIFRTWPLLARWLDEDLDKLKLVEGARAAAEEWDRGGRSAHLLLHRQARLADLVAVTSDPLDERYRPAAESLLADYLAACQAEEQARAAAAARELTAARTLARRTAAGLAAAVVLSMLLGGTLVDALRNRTRAHDQALLALANRLLPTDPTQAGLVLLELERPQDVFGLRAAALAVLAKPLTTAVVAHEGPVLGVDLSADGRLVVAASTDGHARIALVDGRGPAIDLPHDRPLLQAWFSHDARHVATVLDDGRVQLWTVAGHAAGGPVRHRAAATGIAFDPTDRWLASGSIDGSVMLRDVGSDAAAVELRGPLAEAAVTAIAFRADGARLAVASRDGRVQRWRIDGGSATATDCRLFGSPVVAVAWSAATATALLEDGSAVDWADGDPGVPCPGAREALAGRRGIALAAFSADASRWVASDGNGRVLLGTGQEMPVAMPAMPRPARQAWISRDGRSVAAADAAGGVTLWRPGERGLVDLAGHVRRVRAAAFSADGRYLATAADDGSARVWSLDGAGAERVTLEHARNVNDVDTDPARDRVLTASNNGEATLWSVHGQRLTKLVHTRAVEMARFDARGDRIATLAGGDLRLWTVGDQPDVYRSRRLARDVRAATLDSARPRVAAVLADGRVLIVDFDRPGPAAELAPPAPGAVPVAVRFSLDGRVAVVGPAEAMRLWEPGSAQAAETLPHGLGNVLTDAAYDHAGRRIATAARDGVVRLWDVARPARAVRELRHAAPVLQVAWSPDDRQLLTVAEDGIVRLWDTQVDRPPMRLEGDAGRQITSASFSGDGRLVVSSSEDRTARVWSADGRGDPIVLDAGSQAKVQRAVFDRDARHVVSGSADARATIWTIDTQELLALIRGRVHHCLTMPFRIRQFLESEQDAQEHANRCRALLAATPLPAASAAR